MCQCSSEQTLYQDFVGHPYPVRFSPSIAQRSSGIRRRISYSSGVRENTATESAMYMSHLIIAGTCERSEPVVHWNTRRPMVEGTSNTVNHLRLSIQLFLIYYSEMTFFTCCLCKYTDNVYICNSCSKTSVLICQGLHSSRRKQLPGPDLKSSEEKGLKRFRRVH